MISTSKVDRSIIKILNLKDQKNDFAFWQKQPYQKRLQTLEDIRQDFITWKYGSQPGFQRVLNIIELK
jgi:hypothetical protein